MELLFTTEEKMILQIGGIYRYKDADPKDNDAYALCMGRDGFYFLFDGIDHIENECEIDSAHFMEHVEHYTLSINKLKKTWSIKNSGRKSHPDYILVSGNYKDGFEESLRPLLKMFHK